MDVRTAVDWEAKMQWFENNSQALIYGDVTIEVKAEHIGIRELINSRQVLTAAEERVRMRRRSMEKLARGCAGLQMDSNSTDSEESGSENE